jgi:hypothetical protein
MAPAPIAAFAMLAACGALGAQHGWRQGALWLVGGGLGLVLFQAAFSFAGAYRAWLMQGRGAGMRAQFLMLALALLLFLPLLEAGAVAGQPVRGFVFPVGVALAAGAFLFGIGMQIGGGCASGTLYTAAGGQGARMWITLAAFIAGATLAAWGNEHWSGWPALAPVSLPEHFGTPIALAGSLAVLGLAWAATIAIERRCHGSVEPLRFRGGTLLRGPWPLVWGATALALLNLATLVLAGRPWAITAAFPLWGSVLIDALGWGDPVFWEFWEEPTRSEALLRPLLADRTTVMDLGLMAGAFLAATLRGRAAGWRLPAARPALASLIGGLLLGVGAVLASGCNISAYFGGIASGSLHGWAWIGPALLGNWVGARLRPAFALERPRMA